MRRGNLLKLFREISLPLMRYRNDGKTILFSSLRGVNATWQSVEIVWEISLPLKRYRNDGKIIMFSSLRGANATWQSVFL